MQLAFVHPDSENCNSTLQHSAKLASVNHYLIVTLTMTMSSCGLSVRPFVLAFEMFCTTSMPFDTLPNTVCLLSSHGCQSDINKNIFAFVIQRNITQTIPRTSMNVLQIRNWQTLHVHSPGGSTYLLEMTP